MAQGATGEQLRLGPDEAESGIEDLVEGYRRGEFDVSTVIDDSLARIEAWDRQGPILNAMVTIDSRARQRAEGLDQELASTGVARPLHGVPFVVKDNINVAGLPTTGGCAALLDLRPTKDASVVAKLNDAGAVILGKSSMSEFAFGLYDTENSVIEGYTRNPYHLDYASGGSSGGTGVAVAAGYCVAGLGTDTGCSVRSPASVNGVVGLRPTHGLIGYDGVMPLNAEWDTVGPMARGPTFRRSPARKGFRSGSSPMSHEKAIFDGVRTRRTRERRHDHPSARTVVEHVEAARLERRLHHQRRCCRVRRSRDGRR